MYKIKNIILVHGAWADGSCWSKVIPLLDEAGFNVLAVQMPLTTLAEDVAVVKRAMALREGPILLVGHSYGGAVITKAGNDPKVAGLVYVAAFAPDAGESLGSLLATVPPSPLLSEVMSDEGGYIKLSERGILESFAQDLPEAEKKTMISTQGPFFGKIFETPIAVPAWKSRPTWYVIATEDRAIPPALQKTMSERMNATTISVASSHVPMLSKPDKVAAQIMRAAM